MSKIKRFYHCPELNDIHTMRDCLYHSKKLYADKVAYNQAKELITATGHVKLVKEPYTAMGDWAQTTSAFQKLKLKGNAKVTKGGE